MDLLYIDKNWAGWSNIYYLWKHKNINVQPDWTRALSLNPVENSPKEMMAEVTVWGKFLKPYFGAK